MENDPDLVKWKGRRTKTFIAFICESVALGMEYSLTFITLWLYLEKTLHADRPKLYYSLISAAYLLTQVLSSIVFGRLTDEKRNVKGMFFIGNMLIITGNILYTIPLSPWLLFTGRLISGGGGCLRCIMTGEIARSYPESEVSAKFSLMGMAFALGFIVGPALNFGFLYSDFWIGGIHIEYVNAPGFYLALIFVFMQLLTFAMVSNLSKEFDLKEVSIEFDAQSYCNDHKESPNTDDERSALLRKDENGSSKHETDSHLTAMSAVKKMLTNIDTSLILGLSFFFMYCMVSFDLWQPLVVLKLNNWGVLEINIIIFGYGILTVLVLLLVTFFPLSDKVIVYISMVCTFCISCINIIFLVFAEVPENKILSIFLWVCFDLFFAIVVIMEEVFLIGVMAKMTASSYQSFTESIRLGCSRMGALVGLLSASSTFSNLSITCTILAALAILGIFLICVRRRALQFPNVLIQ